MRTRKAFCVRAASLIQTIGRAARHLEGRAILYADVMTDSMKRAIDETNRRRDTQLRYNEENDITPQSIIKPIDMSLVQIAEGDYVTVDRRARDARGGTDARTARQVHRGARGADARRGAQIRV